MNPDFKDFYIRGEKSLKYVVNKMIESEVIDVVVQKLEMLLFTNTGEVYGQPEFGADLEYYLWQTDVTVKDLKSMIISQIGTYIPELETMGYQLNINVYEGSVQDILVLDFIIKGYNVEFIIN
jgi:hypothetical protein